MLNGTKKFLYEALSDTQQFTCNHIFCVFLIKPYNQYKQTHKLPTDTIIKKMKFPLKLIFVKLYKFTVKNTIL